MKAAAASRRGGPAPGAGVGGRPRLAEEWVALSEACGRTLARDINALRTQPPFANSAMDGYALIAADAQSPARRSS